MQPATSSHICKLLLGLGMHPVYRVGVRHASVYRVGEQYAAVT